MWVYTTVRGGHNTPMEVSYKPELGAAWHELKIALKVHYPI